MGTSKHYRGNIGCYECHMALPRWTPSNTRETISTSRHPEGSWRCHTEVTEFNASHHAKAHPRS